ncbi:MAG: hypothetical protein OHK0038_00730 [Flammeovirgaceae bacterium]
MKPLDKPLFSDVDKEETTSQKSSKAHLMLWQRIILFFQEIVYSFPINLLLLHFKKNLILVGFWIFLTGIVAGKIGSSLGIPYLFLDPEYLDKVSFWSFFIVGLTMSGFTVAFHITCYILHGYRYNFLGLIKYPFLKFSLNNSLIPAAFISFYVYKIIIFQLEAENDTVLGLIIKLLGFFAGFFTMIVFYFYYFKFTSRNLFKDFALKLDKKIKKTAMQRQNIMERLNIAKKRKLVITSYYEFPFRLKKVHNSHPLNKAVLIKAFDQNQLNAVIIQLFSLLIIFLLGTFSEVSFLQIPAAASALLLFSMALMFAGAVIYWLRGWGLSVTILAILVFSYYLNQQKGGNPYHKAFGLSYQKKADYTLERIKSLSTHELYEKDKNNTLQILRHWRAKFRSDEKPKMILLCVSGGGQRASIWTLKTLQYLDSLSNGNFLRQTMLITGSSGGLIGASYYRELYLRRLTDKTIKLHSPIYMDKLGKDKLNSMIFSLVVNDLFFRFQKFTLNGNLYHKDRGYALERQLLEHTDNVLDKSLGDYKEAEWLSLIPMLVIAPSIVNDGRKLYISPQPVSYLNSGNIFSDSTHLQVKTNGIEFRRFFAEQMPDSLRFITALRMNATFPYITPNVILPSNPPMEIIDAGLTDNFGVSDAIRFLYVFQNWIAENTSGVILVSIRDTEVEQHISFKEKPTLIDNAFNPISILWGNLQNQQDIRNDNSIEYAKGWFKGNLEYICFEYDNKQGTKDKQRASLSWRLTSQEKKHIIQHIYSDKNQKTAKILLEKMK